MSQAIEVRPARPVDAVAIRALLGACAPPIDGAPDDAESFWVATHAGRLEVERRACEVGARRAYLLTETAEGWFAKRRWRRIERPAAPAGIAASRESAAVCPAAAALMEREL